MPKETMSRLKPGYFTCFSASSMSFAVVAMAST